MGTHSLSIGVPIQSYLPLIREYFRDLNTYLEHNERSWTVRILDNIHSVWRCLPSMSGDKGRHDLNTDAQYL